MLFLLIFLILHVDGYIPIHYNVSKGRNESYAYWCTINILPSHFGYNWGNLPPSYWATYYVYFPAIAEQVQITAAKKMSSHLVQMSIWNATANVEYGYTNTTFEISWGTGTTPVYIGFLNVKSGPGFNITNPSKDYCIVIAIKYGLCATMTGPPSECW